MLGHQPLVEIGMKIREHAGKAARTGLHRIIGNRRIGVDDGKRRAPGQRHPAFHGFEVAGYVLEDDEAAAIGAERQFVVGEQTAIGRRAFVEAEGNLLRQPLEQPAQIVDELGSAFPPGVETVGDEHHAVDPGRGDRGQFGKLIVQAFADVAGSDHRDAAGGGFPDESGELNAFIEAEKLHLAGLADRKQRVRTVVDVPFHQPAEARIVDSAVRGERRDHHGNDAFDLLRHDFSLSIRAMTADGAIAAVPYSTFTGAGCSAAAELATRAAFAMPASAAALRFCGSEPGCTTPADMIRVAASSVLMSTSMILLFGT